MNEIFVAFLFGLILGVWCWAPLKRQYQRVLLSKTRDGTAEFIDGKPIYILTARQWALLRAWRLPTLERIDGDQQMKRQARQEQQ